MEASAFALISAATNGHLMSKARRMKRSSHLHRLQAEQRCIRSFITVKAVLPMQLADALHTKQPKAYDYVLTRLEIGAHARTHKY